MATAQTSSFRRTPVRTESRVEQEHRADRHTPQADPALVNRVPLIAAWRDQQTCYERRSADESLIATQRRPNPLCPQRRVLHGLQATSTRSGDGACST